LPEKCQKINQKTWNAELLSRCRFIQSIATLSLSRDRRKKKKQNKNSKGSTFGYLLFIDSTNILYAEQKNSQLKIDRDHDENKKT